MLGAAPSSVVGADEDFSKNSRSCDAGAPDPRPGEERKESGAAVAPVPGPEERDGEAS